MKKMQSKLNDAVAKMYGDVLKSKTTSKFKKNKIKELDIYFQGMGAGIDSSISVVEGFTEDKEAAKILKKMLNSFSKALNNAQYNL